MAWLPATFTYDLLVGIAVGLVVAALIAGLGLVRSKLLAPLAKARREKLPNLNGSKWQGYSDDLGADAKPHSTLYIKQFGNKVSARVVRNIADGQREFEYQGTLQAGQLLLTFHDLGAPGYIIGAMVLHLESDLKTLKGASTYFHHSKGKVVSTFRTYRKVTA